jgi:hypothetical protein
LRAGKEAGGKNYAGKLGWTGDDPCRLARQVKEFAS